MKEIIAVECNECNGAGFVFWGDDNNFDVETCDCISADLDPAEFIIGM